MRAQLLQQPCPRFRRAAVKYGASGIQNNHAAVLIQRNASKEHILLPQAAEPLTDMERL